MQNIRGSAPPEGLGYLPLMYVGPCPVESYMPLGFMIASSQSKKDKESQLCRCEDGMVTTFLHFRKEV